MEEVLKGTNVLVEFKEIRTILNIESYKSHFKPLLRAIIVLLYKVPLIYYSRST